MRLSVFAYFFLVYSLPVMKMNELQTEELIIKGNVSGVPDGKIYLVESRKWKTPLDSTNIKDGHFNSAQHQLSLFSLLFTIGIAPV